MYFKHDRTVTSRKEFDFSPSPWLLAAVCCWEWRFGTPSLPPAFQIRLPFGRGSIAQVVDIAILVFREGLECMLVLSAITASMMGEDAYRRPVATGVALALATVATWFVAVGIIDNLAQNVSRSISRRRQGCWRSLCC